MPQIHPMSSESAAGPTRTMFDKVRAALGTVPNMMRTMARSPAVLEGYLAFSGALAGGALSAAFRGQLALAVAQANGSAYCLAAHTALGAACGLSDDQAAAARRAASSDPRTAAGLDFARRLVHGRGEIEDGAIARMRALSWSDAEIVEIIAGVALNVFTNYFNRAVGTSVDFPAAPALDPAA